MDVAQPIIGCQAVLLKWLKMHFLALKLVFFSVIPIKISHKFWGSMNGTQFL